MRMSKSASSSSLSTMGDNQHFSLCILLMQPIELARIEITISHRSSFMQRLNTRKVRIKKMKFVIPFTNHNFIADDA